MRFGSSEKRLGRRVACDERIIRRCCHRDFGLDCIDQQFGRRAAVVEFAFDDDDLPNGEDFARGFPGFGKEHKLDRALNVFHLREAHGLAGFGGVRAHAGDKPRHADFFFVVAFAELTGKITDDLGERGLIFVERVVGDV